VAHDYTAIIYQSIIPKLVAVVRNSNSVLMVIGYTKTIHIYTGGDLYRQIRTKYRYG